MKFRTVLCDPPWHVDFIQLKMRPNQIKMPYPTMMTKEIMAIPVSSIADKDCNLFLWTTHTYLPDALKVAEAWGFKYHALMTWDKAGQGRPCCGFKRDTEFLIYAYRGKITVNQRGAFIHTLFREPVQKHSQKPDIVYTIIERNSPEPRVELFARCLRPGWWSCGDALNGEDILDTFKKKSFLYTPLSKWRRL
jgi:N6-adenosine-specific RNA methylase IME4